MNNKLLFLALLFFISLCGKAQTPLAGTNWYLTKIEENNQTENVPISIDGKTQGNWHFFITPPAFEGADTDLSSSYCSTFGGGISLTTTSFNFSDIHLTLNLPCEWMTTEEIQYFSKYYSFFKNYQNDTFTYLIQSNELIITNSAGNKAYYGSAPLSIEEPLEQNIKIYPNPFEERFVIEDSEQIIEEIKIFDNAGRLIKVISNPTPLQEIHGDFSSGIYYINIKAKDGRIMNKKMIKK